MTEHISFPKTPHYSGSAVIDDDLTLSAVDFRRLAGDRVVRIEEKLDGTAVGISFENGVPVLHKRSGLILTGEHPQYNAFRRYVFEHAESLYAVTGEEFALFGEWLYATHAIFYDALPSFLVAFDLARKCDRVFLASEHLVERCAEGVPIVPLLWTGTVDNMPSFEALSARSRFAEGPAEGVYLRVQDNERIIARCKWRRASFSCGREDFDTHLRKNRLRGQ